MTGATLILAAIDETHKTNQSPEPATVAPEAQRDVSVRAAPTPPPSNDAKQRARPARLSFGLEDVVKMVQSGVATDVVLTYIDNSTVAYYPTAEDVVQLHESRVPSQVTAELIRHGGKLRAQQAQANKESQSSMAQQMAPAQSYSPAYNYAAQPPPQTAYATYNYTYPSYVYSGYPSCSYAYPAYSYVPYPSFYFSYSTPFYYRHSYRHHYFHSYPRSFHSGVSVGFNYGRFSHGSPRIYGRVRF